MVVKKDMPHFKLKKMCIPTGECINDAKLVLWIPNNCVWSIVLKYKCGHFKLL
jgi:hypothetical protein